MLRKTVWLLGATLSAVSLLAMGFAVLSLQASALGWGIANSLSAPVWGRLGDRSSRLVMSLAAFSAAALSITVYFAVITQSALLASAWFHAGVFPLLTVSHSGVRLGRKTYLVDMADAENRATYVAVSNTVIGIVRLAAEIHASA